MELEKLRIFLAVAECRSFTLGARRLYISHSSTSRAVAALEEELGVKLLERGNRVLGLTPAGEVLLREVEGILGAVDGIKEKLSRVSEGSEN
ncbi:MAG: LysR family transcriptional regulator [Oscillospiraceae bacterium]|nr:LysR family transcriptional regulator [Oscillospiraceae bacterium]